MSNASTATCSLSSTPSPQDGFTFHVTITFEPHEAHHAVRNLRVQVPEPAPHTPPPRRSIRVPAAPIKARPSVYKEEDLKQEVTLETDSNSDVEYVEASPRFTWTDEHSKRSDEKEEWKQLMWNGLLAEYPFARLSTEPLELSAQPFHLDTFYQSKYYLNQHQFPHHNIGDLMRLYMEMDGRFAYVLHMNKNRLHDEYLRREQLIQRFFIPKKIVWNPVYYHAYCEWSEDMRGRDPEFKRLNRFQRMSRFMQAFFE